MSSATVAAPPAGPLSRLLNSTIGAKVVMAASGMVMVGWLLGHLSGNLLIFAGADAMNAYAAWLHATPAMLWGARVVLLVAVVLHVITAIRLKRLGNEARPSRYRYDANVQSTLAGRTMLYSGLMIAAYGIYHLAHFTWGVEALMAAEHFHGGVKDALGRPNVWHTVVWSFTQAPVAIVYIVANALLGLHLSHGIGSVFQTLGLTNTKWRPVIERIGPAFGAIIAAGFISIPVAVLLGLVSLPA